LAPLTRVEAEHMLETTWAGRRLAGFRHMAAGDQEAAIQALIRLGQLAIDFPQIAEVEVNPLRVMEQGALALDIRLRLAVK
jgi:succinyl-CoA synthetase beta subunit